MASAAQYGFLVSCESRISLLNTGPYKIADGVEMIVRDFMDLAEGDFPWLDDVAADIPYNNLTVPMLVKDCHFYLVDDWGSFESEPEFRAENIIGVGLYTSDPLTDGHIPVGMDNRETLTLVAMQHLAETGQKNAIISMCMGAGQGLAMLIERVVH